MWLPEHDTTEGYVNMAWILKAQWIVPGASMNLTVNIKLFLKLIYITYSFRS